MIWHDTAWIGMTWNALAWFGIACHELAWLGMAQHCLVWHSVAQTSDHAVCSRSAGWGARTPSTPSRCSVPALLHTWLLTIIIITPPAHGLSHGAQHIKLFKADCRRRRAALGPGCRRVHPSPPPQPLPKKKSKHIYIIWGTTVVWFFPPAEPHRLPVGG